MVRLFKKQIFLLLFVTIFLGIISFQASGTYFDWYVIDSTEGATGHGEHIGHEGYIIFGFTNITSKVPITFKVTDGGSLVETFTVTVSGATPILVSSGAQYKTYFIPVVHTGVEIRVDDNNDYPDKEETPGADIWFSAYKSVVSLNFDEVPAWIPNTDKHFDKFYAKVKASSNHNNLPIEGAKVYWLYEDPSPQNIGGDAVFKNAEGTEITDSSTDATGEADAQIWTDPNNTKVADDYRIKITLDSDKAIDSYYVKAPDKKIVIVSDQALVDEAKVYCDNHSNTDWTNRDDNTVTDPVTDAVAYSYGCKDALAHFNADMTDAGGTAPGNIWGNYPADNYRPRLKDTEYNLWHDYPGTYPQYNPVRWAGVDCSGFVQRAAHASQEWHTGVHDLGGRILYGGTNPSDADIIDTSEWASDTYTTSVTSLDNAIIGNLYTKSGHVVIVTGLAPRGERTRSNTDIIHAWGSADKVVTGKLSDLATGYSGRRIKP